MELNFYKFMPKEVTVVTKEIELPVFHSGLFLFQEESILCPVAVPIIYQPQFIEHFYEELKRIPMVWASYAAVGGIAQVSLKSRRDLCLLARFNAYFREPTEEEIRADFHSFGEQVMGPLLSKASEKDKLRPTFRVWDEEYVYDGPERLLKGVFVTKVFNGAPPQDISDIVKEVDGISETGRMTISQGYQFFNASRGKLRYLPFKEPREYDTRRLSPHGFIEIDDKKMTYYPDEFRNNPVDFTQLLRK